MSVYPNLLAGQRITAALLESMQPLWIGKTVTTDRASTTTISADPELVLPVEANAEYVFEYYWRVSGITAGGIDIQVSVPTGATGSYSTTRLAADQADTGTRTSTRIAFNVETEFSTPSTSAHQVIGGFGRVITGSTAGNVSIDWAQNASNATASSMHSDSWISLRRVA